MLGALSVVGGFLVGLPGQLFGRPDAQPHRALPASGDGAARGLTARSRTPARPRTPSACRPSGCSSSPRSLVAVAGGSGWRAASTSAPRPSRRARRLAERFPVVYTLRRRQVLGRRALRRARRAAVRRSRPLLVEGGRRGGHRRRPSTRSAFVVELTGDFLRFLQTGNVRNYALSVALAASWSSPWSLLVGGGDRARHLAALARHPPPGSPARSLLAAAARRARPRCTAGSRSRAVARGTSSCPALVWLALRRRPARASSSASSCTWIPQLGISYHLGVDGISLLLVLLTDAAARRSSSSPPGPRSTTHVKGFRIALLLLETGMLGAFVALDLFLFYVFWELMLVPMYFIIGVWGGERRIYAAMKFVLFTMVGSLLMLVAILYLAWLPPRSRPGPGRSTTSRHRDHCAADRRSPACGSPQAAALRSPSPSPSRSRCRSSRSTPGCPTPTSRRRPAARSSSPASC